MDLSKEELKALKDIKARSKGWPVGIPIEENMAKNLVAKELAKWAPPAWTYPEPVFSVRITSLGEAYI